MLAGMNISKRPTPMNMRGVGLSRYFLGLEGLDHVAHLDVLEALEPDATLESGCDLAHVVLEALQRSHSCLVDHGTVAHETSPGIATNDSLGDIATGHGSGAQNVDPDERLIELGELVGQRLHRSLCVGLQQEIELGNLALGGRLKQLR